MPTVKHTYNNYKWLSIQIKYWEALLFYIANYTSWCLHLFSEKMHIFVISFHVDIKTNNVGIEITHLLIINHDNYFNTILWYPYHFLKMKANLYNGLMGLFTFNDKGLDLGLLFGAQNLEFFRVDWYFLFIIINTLEHCFI